jgi:signal transduction histidine kinase
VELEARLIDDLLDLTRIVRGKIELRSEVVNVHAIVTDAMNICRTDISAKRQELVLVLRASEFHVNGDAVRIQQILWNLLRNAVKFTPEGGQIVIRSHNEGGNICIAIIDTGIGIEAQAIGRIFSPFEQAGRMITQQFGGLGDQQEAGGAARGNRHCPKRRARSRRYLYADSAGRPGARGGPGDHQTGRARRAGTPAENPFG